jgi:hypothetical protein
MKSYEKFNHSKFSKFLNNKTGRIFRMGMGIGFIVVGYIFREHALGSLSIMWGILAFSAGFFDVCFISAVLGGPLAGAKIRAVNAEAPTSE